jgi:hypothetical protein
MKLAFFLLALCGLSLAGHPFFAEQNLICKLCQESLKIVKEGEFSKLENMVFHFPHMINMIVEHKQQISRLDDGEDICKLIYCKDDFEDFEIDHDQIIFDVNRLYSEGKSTWIAGNSDRFKNSKASEIRK